MNYKLPLIKKQTITIKEFLENRSLYVNMAICYVIHVPGWLFPLYVGMSLKDVFNRIVTHIGKLFGDDNGNIIIEQISENQDHNVKSYTGKPVRGYAKMKQHAIDNNAFFTLEEFLNFELTLYIYSEQSNTKLSEDSIDLDPNKIFSNIKLIKDREDALINDLRPVFNDETYQGHLNSNNYYNNS